MKRLLLTLAVLGCAKAISSPANPGDEVIVIYNTRFPESKQVAYYYAQRRGVPANQIFGFEMTEKEDMSRAEFRDTLQKGLVKKLEANKLWHIGSEIIHPTTNQPGRVEWKVLESKVRYAVLCYGVPLRVGDDPNYKPDEPDASRPEMRRTGAAVDSELALLPMMEQNYPLGGPFRNPVAGATN